MNGAGATAARRASSPSGGLLEREHELTAIDAALAASYSVRFASVCER